MNIQTMLYGYRARASEDELNIMRKVCQAIKAATEGHDAFVPLYDQADDEIRSIDIDIEGLRREQKWAEQNAKYREDRPNA